MNLKNKTYSQPCLPELVAVILAGAFHVLTELLVSPAAAYIYNITMCVILLGYLAWRVVFFEKVFQTWGIRRDTFKAALRIQLPYAAAGVVLILLFGYFAGNLPLPRTFWMVMGLYPLWGIAQQFALQNFIGNNLVAWVRHPLGHALGTAGLFSAAHFPNYRLMALTLVAGFFFTLLYRKKPNLWVVGILHGFLGALAYYVVLGEDPGQMLVDYLNRL